MRRAQVFFIAGGLVAVPGVFGLWGWPAADLLFGALVLAYGLLFIDVDAPKAKK